MDEMKNKPVIVERIGQHWGQYRIISAVEQGKFSKAYLAEHIHNRSKQLVIEILPITLNQDSVQSFLQSAQQLTRLTHPHILRLVDAGVENFTPFIVMDYVSHIPLRQLYPAREGRSLDKLLPYLKQVVEALQYAHEKTFLHKNLRPDTILLGSNGTILLSGFAIDVVDQNEHFQKYQRIKEPIDPMAYMAPEQIQQKATKASDQYALGVMVYEWLCGFPPFQGSFAEIANQQIHRLPPGLHQRVPTILPEVEEVVLIALAKDPSKRFASVTAFLRSLEQACGSRAVEPQNRSISPSSTLAASAAPTVPSLAPLNAQPAALPVAIPATRGIEAVNTVTLAQAEHSARPAKTQPKAGNSTRRAFLVSAAGVALVGGGGGWLLWQRLHPANATADSGSSNMGNDTTTTPAPNAPPVVYRGHQARVNAVAWSPDGKRLASASDDKRVLICDRSGHTVLTYSGHRDRVNAVAWSPNGKYIASASADKTVQVWIASSGKLVYTYKGHRAAVNGIDWSADSRMIASGSDDKTVHAWFATKGTVFLFYREHTNAVQSVAWSPNTKKIASGSWDTTLQVCSTITNDAFAVGDRIFSYGAHTAEVYSVGWSPDGTRIVSAGGDNVVQVCNGIDGSSVHYPPRRHDKAVRSVAWSPNGNTIASASDDKTVRIWDAHTGQETLSFSGHSDAVLSVAWLQDSTIIASAGTDKTVQIWSPKR